MRAIAVLLVLLAGCSTSGPADPGDPSEHSGSDPADQGADCDAAMIIRDSVGGCALLIGCSHPKQEPYVSSSAESGACTSLRENACVSTANCCAVYTLGVSDKSISNPFVACHTLR